MSRAFRPTDLVRLTLTPGSYAQDRAWTLAQVVEGAGQARSPRTIIRQSVLPRKRRCLRVSHERGRPYCMAAVRPRLGSSVWEIEHLYAPDDPDWEGVTLLEDLCAAAAEGGAHRVFLRLPVESPLIETAHRSGFTLTYKETLLRRSDPWHGPPVEELPGWRARTPAYDYAVYRHYLACAPVGVRSVCAATLDEWHDALESGGRPVVDHLLWDEGETEPAGVVTAWVRTWAHGRTGALQVLARPGAHELSELVRYALGSLSGKPQLLALVPDFQPEVGAELMDCGFHLAEEYSVLAKSVTVRAGEVVFAPIQP